LDTAIKYPHIVVFLFSNNLYRWESKKIKLKVEHSLDNNETTVFIEVHKSTIVHPFKGFSDTVLLLLHLLRFNVFLFSLTLSLSGLTRTAMNERHTQREAGIESSFVYRSALSRKNAIFVLKSVLCWQTVNGG